MTDRSLHIVLGSKGLTGKSLVAGLLVEYLAVTEGMPTCLSVAHWPNTGIDRIARFEAQYIDSAEDTFRMDGAFERALLLRRSTLIDCSSESFWMMLDYLQRSPVLEVFERNDIAVHFHTVLWGGESSKAPLRDLRTLRSLTGETRGLTVWCNPVLGPVEMNGRHIFEAPELRDGCVPGENWLDLPDPHNSSSDAALLRRLQVAGLTFAQAIRGEAPFGIMDRERLRVFRVNCFAVMDDIIGASSTRLSATAHQGGNEKEQTVNIDNQQQETERSPMPRRSTARAEIAGCAEEALQRLETGETLIVIHEDLVRRGAITCAYRTFARWMNRFQRDGRPRFTGCRRR